MPLRDHFRPPLLNNPNAESINATWATMLLQRLNATTLTDGYRAEQEVYAGPRVTIDLGTLERQPTNGHPAAGGGGVAVATRRYAPPAVLAGDVSFADAALFEIRVLTDDGRVAAAIELVSRSNKDRPDSRRAFAVRCASYLQAGVSVAFVDPVTGRRADLHSELVRLLDLPESLHWASPDGIAAVSYRMAVGGETGRLEVWPVGLAIGSPLPEVPLWLAPDVAVPLDLEATYEAAWACHRR
ncbi:MAG: hypothetical protein C0501_10280 [Isosphaera sp.]|nr:hypothetical protein [Isosphaera sp.]